MTTDAKGKTMDSAIFTDNVLHHASMCKICEALLHKSMLKEPNQASDHTYRKGQLFIIAAVFIIAGLVLIFGAVSSPTIVEEKKFQDVGVLDKNSKDILNQYKYAAGVATLNSPANVSIQTYMRNLSDYYRREIDSNIIYAAVMLNGSTQRFSVDIGNYLQDQIDMNISAPGSAPNSIRFTLNDKADQSIDFLAAANTMVNITLNYTIGSARTVDAFSINSSTKNFMLLFVDTRLKDGGYEIRLKDTYNRSW